MYTCKVSHISRFDFNLSHPCVLSHSCPVPNQEAMNVILNYDAMFLCTQSSYDLTIWSDDISDGLRTFNLRNKSYIYELFINNF